MRRIHPSIIISVIGVSLICLYLSTREVDIFNPSVNLSQDDPLILEYIRKHHLHPPPFLPLSSNVTKVTKVFPRDANQLTKALLEKEDRKGFFIECGANDGEFLSNTLGLEVLKNWTGLLVEASPYLFKKLQSKNRNAWLADTCLTGKHPEKIEFLKHKETYPNWRVGIGKVDFGNKYEEPGSQLSPFKDEKLFNRSDYESEGMVDCMPLYSILSAIGVKNVDFFSLDVEGHEYYVLEAIPFDKINIDVILVEHWLAPQGPEAIKCLILSKGYSLLFEDDRDFIFKKNVKK